ncbi:MAG: NAD(P)H-dependent oxidoreductase [Actinomycetota bacterium]|nr:NAD(P)H-dependent oxidoreductase [Actinomycetota bacterium]
MPQPPLNLAVIVGSTREGRFGGIVGQWFVGHAARRADMELDVIDLADLDLPAVLPRGRDGDLDTYLKRIDVADAYVVITPEYNHGYPASLKQAIDLPHDEWKAKPVGFVSYGGMAGGLRAVEQLRQVFAELHVATMRDTVSFHQFFELFDESGQPKDPSGPAEAATVMLDQLAWWGQALRVGRAARPPA